MYGFKNAKVLSKDERDALFAKCRDKGGTLRITVAPTVMTRKHRRTIDRILWAMDPKEGTFRGSLITDESTLSDFSLTAKELQQLSRRVGFECRDDTHLAGLARSIDRAAPCTFKDYVFRCNLSKAADYAVATHAKVKNGRKLIGMYKAAIMQMAYLTTAELGRGLEGYSLRVNRQGQVDGTHCEKQDIAVEFIRWEKLLRMPVITPFGIDKTVGKLMFEATFAGFDQNRIQLKFKKLHDIVKSIKKHPERFERMTPAADAYLNVSQKHRKSLDKLAD